MKKTAKKTQCREKSKLISSITVTSLCKVLNRDDSNEYNIEIDDKYAKILSMKL